MDRGWGKGGGGVVVARGSLIIRVGGVGSRGVASGGDGSGALLSLALKRA